ncbi:MAG: 50S ribosomal protein L31 [Pseudomonadota bacterium]|nr:50S ribosomal protein L31 [Pseudomonadota bacterium]|tara:strand:+ start:323 stop:553 length:231 start_codon:yes stop_codon:yes gene_type:complete
MQDKIHPELRSAVFTCANCSSTYNLIGSFYQDKFIVEQCQNCHSAYTGDNSTANISSSRTDAFKQRFAGFDFAKKK